ncbi:choice-of-anchor X domain-containing protein [Massilia sp. 9096]|uniref:choice-of-anchor X domain-containing protein n=1 Tax=Massilia sp. 9096 TaxID=1500894 RepID=UPI0005670500|nr:choice-of-anchor X domain-containing protein [Massilia sp. 9096]
MSRSRRIALPLAILAALLVAAWALFWHEPAPARTAAQARAQAEHAFFAPVQGGAGLPLPDGRAQRRRALLGNVQLADHTYCSYRQSTQYPFNSRPMSENADRANPNAPVTEMRPMHLQDGGANPAVQLQTSQSRVYMAANEAVAFSIRAVDANGRTLPLVITRALAQGITYAGTRASSQVSVPFVDDGSGADPVPNDGAFAAILAPAQSGLAGFAGTIRTEVRYSVGGKNGALLFDVIYTPELPAVWSGAPREAIENGSLEFLLPAEVRMPGRYVIEGRVDDAKGRPFALLTFNDVLGPGPNVVKLAVFGKLMRDQDAALPLTLRDVDGYLLKENADPDRAMLPRLEGKVYTSKASSNKGFSSDEWQSEERTRYLTEYAKDVTQAKNALARFDPFAPLPASECAFKAP